MHRFRSLQYIFLLMLLLAAALPAAAVVPPQPIPSELKAAVAKAESAGRALFQSYGAGPSTYPPAITKAMATAAAALKTRCTAPGRLVMLDPNQPSPEGIVLYQIPQLPPEKQGLM